MNHSVQSPSICSQSIILSLILLMFYSDSTIMQWEHCPPSVSSFFAAIEITQRTEDMSDSDVLDAAEAAIQPE